MKKITDFFSGRSAARVIMISAIVMTMLVSTGCVNLSKMKQNVNLTSVMLESFTPKGMRGADAILKLGLKNDMFGFKLADVHGVIKYKGRNFAEYKVDPMKIAGHTEKEYHFPCSANLCQDVSFLDVLGLAGAKSTSDFTVDVNVKVKVGIFSKVFKFKDMPVSRFLKNKSLGKLKF